MSQITKAIILERAWKELDRTFKRGDLCGHCEHFDGSSGSYTEEPWSMCLIQEEGDNPFACPGVSRDDIIETLAAEAEEAYEASKDR